MPAELDPALITTPSLGREGLSRTQITQAERVSPLCVRIPRWARMGCAELGWNLGSSAEPWSGAGRGWDSALQAGITAVNTAGVL